MTACGALLSPWVAPTHCFEPTFTTDGSAQLATDGDCFPSACYGAYYSPAVCPSGWNTYTTWLSNWPSPSPQPSETAYGCCPGSLTGQNSLMGCAGHIVATVGLTINAQGQTSTTTFAPSSVSVSAYDLKIRAKNSDSAAFTAATASKSTASASPTVSHSSTASSDSSSLSTGAKAAIGVVIPIAVIAFAIGVFFLFRRHAKHKRRLSEQTLAEEPGKTEQYGCGDMQQSSSPYEIAPTWGANPELPGHDRYLAEIDSTQKPVETEGMPIHMAFGPPVEKPADAMSPVAEIESKRDEPHVASDVSSPSDEAAQRHQVPLSDTSSPLTSATGWSERVQGTSPDGTPAHVGAVDTNPGSGSNMI